MKYFPDNFRNWLPGILTALIGVTCVRLLAPQLSGRGQAALVILGYLLVPVGLGLVARRIHQRAVANQGTMGDRP
jgi:predicted Na+-dependent transporter